MENVGNQDFGLRLVLNTALFVQNFNSKETELFGYKSWVNNFLLFGGRGCTFITNLYKEYCKMTRLCKKGSEGAKGGGGWQNNPKTNGSNLKKDSESVFVHVIKSPESLNVWNTYWNLLSHIKLIRTWYFI